MHTKSLPSSQYANESKYINPALGILVSLCIGAIPVNIFPRGGFQPVDGFISLLIIYYIFSQSKLHDNVKHHIFLLLPFVIWVQIVMIGYYAYHKNIVLFVISINIIYAFFMLYTFSNMWVDILSKNGLKYVYLGLIIAAICVFTFKGHKEWDEVRFSFSFNNPNQLALYSMLSFSIIILLINYKIDLNSNTYSNSNSSIIFFVLDVFFVLLFHYLILMAITRAAIAGTVFLNICLLKDMLSKKMFLPVASTIMAGVIVLLIFNPYFIKERIETRGTDRFTSEALENRIEHAIAEPLKDLVGFKIFYGTGQIPIVAQMGSNLAIGGKGGPPTKTDKGEKTVEVHNMFGNILWSYGLIGLFFYAFWIARTIWKVRFIPGTLFIWAAILTFSIGGVVYRVRSFWLILGLMMALLSMSNQHEKNNSISLK